MKVTQSAKSIDDMLRQTRQHHVQLSVLADFKANILLTIATVLLTGASRYLYDANYAWPARVLCVFCVLTVMLACYAVMPKFRSHLKPATVEDVKNPYFNLLFFGDYLKLSWEQFESEMNKVINDDNLVYEMMTRELYTMGLYLKNKKYRFLRYAYSAFASGVLLSFLTLVMIQVTQHFSTAG